MNVVRPGPDSTRAGRPCARPARGDGQAEARALRVVGGEEGFEDARQLGAVDPGPASRTAARRCRCARAALTTMSVPGGVCVSALSIRIRTIWATRSGSQSASIGAAPEAQLQVGVVLGAARA